MIYLVFRNENSYKIWYTNSSFQELISSACYRFTYKIWGISTYLPREGTETYTGGNFFLVLLLYIYLSTSKGAGNIDGKYSKSAFPSYRYLSTLRGAGNCIPISFAKR